MGRPPTISREQILQAARVVFSEDDRRETAHVHVLDAQGLKR